MLQQKNKTDTIHQKQTQHNLNDPPPLRKPFCFFPHGVTHHKKKIGQPQETNGLDLADRAEILLARSIFFVANPQRPVRAGSSSRVCVYSHRATVLVLYRAHCWAASIALASRTIAAAALSTSLRVVCLDKSARESEKKKNVYVHMYVPLVRPAPTYSGG